MNTFGYAKKSDVFADDKPSQRLRCALLIACFPLVSAMACVNAATLPAGFTETQVGGSLDGAPTAMAFAPDGRLFVCLQDGVVRVIKNDALLPQPFVELSVDSSGERGLLGVAFDPGFATNHYVYLYYTVATSPAHNRVSRFTANGDVAAANSETPILDLNNLSSASNHNGGAIHFGPDGKLYVAVGENANGSNAQTLSNLLGKMLRINSDGTVPADNPFYSTASGINRAIWALGLRNPFTFAFQPGTSRMFINDVGQSAWEEINDGVPGSNYGWPTTEGPTTDSRFRAPIFAYGHDGPNSSTGCAITGGAFYNPGVSQFPSSYVGKYFFAEFCNGWIRLFNPATGNASDFASGIANPVDLQVGPEGALYYAARGNGGEIYRIHAAASQLTNISTRARVGIGDRATIAGFIVAGSGPTNLLVRGIGPSLPPVVPDRLADPVLDVYAAGGSPLAHNNDWKDTQRQQIEATRLAPTKDVEAAAVGALQSGSYTALLSGRNGGTGIGLVEVYAVDGDAASKLANISTRGVVGIGDNVLIGGFTLGQNIGAARLIVRAIGPSLEQRGVENPLPNPTLELRDADATLIAKNDDWQENPDQKAQLMDSGIAPTDPAESAIAASLPPGAYTAIVAGKNGGAGIGLVEIYRLP